MYTVKEAASLGKLVVEYYGRIRSVRLGSEVVVGEEAINTLLDSLKDIIVRTSLNSVLRSEESNAANIIDYQTYRSLILGLTAYWLDEVGKQRNTGNPGRPRIKRYTNYEVSQTKQFVRLVNSSYTGSLATTSKEEEVLGYFLQKAQALPLQPASSGNLSREEAQKTGGVVAVDKPNFSLHIEALFMVLLFDSLVQFDNILHITTPVIDVQKGGYDFDLFSKKIDIRFAQRRGSIQLMNEIYLVYLPSPARFTGRDFRNWQSSFTEFCRGICEGARRRIPEVV